MPDDPLITALYNHQLLTPFDVEASIRYRRAKIRDLELEIEALHTLRGESNDVRALRAERDPPIEASERTYH